MPVEGTWRSHQVPLADVRDERRSTCALLEEWLRSYRPEELFDDERRARAGARRAARRGRAAHEREPARERRRAAARPRPARLPRLRRRRRRARARRRARRRACSARFLRDVIARNPDELPPLRPRRDRLEPARRRLRGDRPRVGGRDRCRPTSTSRPTGRVHGGALRAPLPGLARGLPADRPARPLQLLRGVHPHRRLDVQPAREVAEGDARHPVAAPDRVAQLPAQLARLAPGPQRLLAPGSRASSTTS